MATDRAADVRIRGNAPVGGRNAFTAAEQARVDAATAAAVAQIKIPTATVSTGISEKTDWIEQLRLIFSNYGLDSLAPKITEFIQMGYSPDTVTLKLQETPEYKQRFIGNESRRKAGLPVLNPAEYLSVEASYKKIMRDAELPAGFYDQPDDFGKFIGADVSPTELQERVSIANQSLQNADPFYTDSLRRFYGLNTGDMIAYTLDPE